MSADEAFCCGTAAVISPIGSITLGDKLQLTQMVLLPEKSHKSCTMPSLVFRTKLAMTSSDGFTQFQACDF